MGRTLPGQNLTAGSSRNSRETSSGLGAGGRKQFCPALHLSAPHHLGLCANRRWSAQARSGLGSHSGNDSRIPGDSLAGLVCLQEFWHQGSCLFVKVPPPIVCVICNHPPHKSSFVSHLEYREQPNFSFFCQYFVNLTIQILYTLLK